ncbi:MAG: lipoyl(octanoyl) transferase LipB [Gemmataceae bacterium]|nr:lipoyl(octanoyl) transferase LipB [Gemmataceae bacterium]
MSLWLLTGRQCEKQPMGLLAPLPPSPFAPELTLQAYLLGSVEFEAALALQRRLAFQVSGDRESAHLVVCEHPPVITVGRHGSRAHILCEPDELRLRRWPVRWLNRGGGCLLHAPGQLAIYPILALDTLGFGLEAYIDRLQEAVIALLDDFSIHGETLPGHAGVFVSGRPIAGIGIAVRNWVTYHGVYLNVAPDLEPFRRIRFGGSLEDGQMTSVARERRGLVRPSLIRERLLEHFAAHFGFARTVIFHEHPQLNHRAPSDAVATTR